MCKQKNEISNMKSDAKKLLVMFKDYDDTNDKHKQLLEKWTLASEKCYRDRGVVPIDSEKTLSLFRLTKELIVERYRIREKIRKMEEAIESTKKEIETMEIDHAAIDTYTHMLDLEFGRNTFPQNEEEEESDFQGIISEATLHYKNMQELLEQKNVSAFYDEKIMKEGILNEMDLYDDFYREMKNQSSTKKSKED